MSRLSAVVAAALACSSAVATAACRGPLTRTEVVRCALSQDLDLRQARQELEVLAGQRQTAGVLLPANPTVAVSLFARRFPTGSPPTLNWQVSLAQELEIAGQRGARLKVVDAAVQAQRRRVTVVEQVVAARALELFYRVVAARATRTLTDEVGQVAALLDRFAAARVQESLIAPVDADLLRVEAVRVARLGIEAARREEASLNALAVLLGQPPESRPRIEGALEADLPHPVDPPESRLASLVTDALRLRGEVATAELERRVWTRQGELLRRARVSNLTVSAFVGRDGFDEQIYGGGLSLPIPLPAPLGRTHAGQLAETAARAAQAATTSEAVRRQVRLEVVEAFQEERARAVALRLYPEELLTRVRGDLLALREGIVARQLSVREAALAERTFVDLLVAYVQERLGYALAAVALERAAGLPIGGGR